MLYDISILVSHPLCWHIECKWKWFIDLCGRVCAIPKWVRRKCRHWFLLSGSFGHDKPCRKISGMSSFVTSRWSPWRRLPNDVTCSKSLTNYWNQWPYDDVEEKRLRVGWVVQNIVLGYKMYTFAKCGPLGLLEIALRTTSLPRRPTGLLPNYSFPQLSLWE
jgi:hypothetical protein